VVLGVSNEPKKLVTETVQKTERKYAIAIVKGEKTDAFYGVKGFPSACLLDARGRVVWVGQGGEAPEEKLISDALAKAALVSPLPDAYKDINKLLSKQEFGKAWDAAGKALASKAGDKDLERVRSEIEGALKKRMDQAKKAADAKDFGEAVDLYEEVIAEFEGMPTVDAKTPRDAITADPEAKDDLAAAAQMKKADAEVRKGEFEKAMAIWKAAAKRYPDTKSGARAATAVAKHPAKPEKA
jgi:tetratricopeptide (TPR) repeat protein